jgi:hypothetical protein
VQYAKTAANQVFHKVVPYGVATGPDHKTQSYATTPSIREAAMIVAVDIWQARQVSQTGGVGMDGISASPYRMGYQMINRMQRSHPALFKHPHHWWANGRNKYITCTLATALANAGVWSTFSFPPATLVSAPAIVNAASGDLLVSEITVSILTSWS